MNCKICGSKTEKVFRKKILFKYDIDYYHCTHCEFLQTEKPYWLEESYNSPINYSDTGIIMRNQSLSKATALVLYFCFGKNLKYLDYAGGYGLFTRMMRDMGFDYYWHDPYTKNLVSRGFEYDSMQDIAAISTFESFEHFEDPLTEIEKMLAISPNIIFSTQLLPEPLPKPHEWWYYAFDHGQHIAFYRKKTLEWIADKYDLHFYSIKSFHMFSKKKVSPLRFKLLAIGSKLGLANILRRTMKGKTVDDMQLMIVRAQKE